MDSMNGVNGGLGKSKERGCAEEAGRGGEEEMCGEEVKTDDLVESESILSK